MFSKVWLASQYMWSVAYFTLRQPQASTHYQCFPFSQASLKPADLSAFAHVCSDPRAQHYSQVIQRRAGACTDRTRVRNHRYAALRALQRGRSKYSSMLYLYRHVLVLTVPPSPRGQVFQWGTDAIEGASTLWAIHRPVPDWWRGDISSHYIDFFFFSFYKWRYFCGF